MSEEPNIRLGLVQLLRAEATNIPLWLKVACLPMAHMLDKFLTWTSYNRFVEGLDLSMNFQAFIAECMKEYNLSISDVDGLLDKIPRQGPLIIASNHPTGFLETVVLPHLIMQVRPELKILANEMLAQVHWIAPQIIPLNVFRTSGVRGILQTAEQWLTNGGSLLIYPSGEVADYKKNHGRVTDGHWSRLPLILAGKTNAKIIHLNLAAKTSTWFRIVNRICRPIRVMWLMKELYRQGGKSISCYSSLVLSLASLPAASQEKSIRFLHALNDCLPQAAEYQGAVGDQPEKKAPQPLAAQLELSWVRQELESLPEEAIIYSHKSTVVYVVIGSRIPVALKYIEVERERTFREVGMGTGNASDGDCHDETSLHVIVWDKHKHAMIASTRCEIFCQEKTDTYLSDSHHVAVDKLLAMGDMMEVSRTFVLPDYQRSFSSLLCLWRGLSRTVLRYERIRFVSGVVSIAGNRMNEALFDCLAAHVHMVAEKNKQLGQLFSPRYPYKIQRPVSPEIKHCLSLVSSVDELEHLFRELTKGNCQLPVLFRQYESLGTVPLTVSVDKEFGACIDVLQVWDTHDLRSEKLRLFFGDDGIDELKRRAKK